MKDNFAAAVERTTQPLRSTYEGDLAKLAGQFTRSGDREAAEAVKAELEALTSGNSAPPSPAPPALATLRENYQKALKRAMAPLDKTYETELWKLYEHHAKADEMAALLDVKAELDRISTKPPLGKEQPTEEAADSEGPELTGKRLTRSQQKEVEKRFLGTSWTPLPQKDDIYSFHKNGVCTRTIPAKSFASTGKWEVEDDGTVVIKGVGGNPKWVWFHTANTGEFVPNNKADKRVQFGKLSSAPAP